MRRVADRRATASSAPDLLLVAGVRPGPVDDPAGADDGLALSESENGQADLAGHLLDLLATATPLAPGPRDHAVAGQIPDLILISGVVECLRCATTWVTHRREG